MDERIKYIGIVRSSFTNVKDCPLQENENAPEAIIQVYENFKEGISDIKEGTRLIIFSWLHQADRTVLKTKPRNDERASMTGVFSTRSPHRPNPIGMHVAKVIAMNGCHIHVSQLELLDGTPIIDMKPVI